MKEKFTKEELDFLENQRKINERIKNADAELVKVLQKYNVNLIVDGNSTLNNLKIILVPNEK